MSDYRSNNVNRIYDYSENLRWLHFQTIGLQHGIRFDEQSIWERYNPTHFLYAFFCFNTFYSIDWVRSLTDGRISNFGRSITEGEKYQSLLDFCFENEDFCDDFRDKFIYIITTELTKNEIFGIIETITRDAHYLGNIKREEDIENFKDAVHSIFESETLYIEDVETIISFIYRIRNNIFHGTKTLQDMLIPTHQTKLLFYTYFVLAVNQMLFSYLDFIYDECNARLNPHKYDNHYNSLMRILEEKRERGGNINNEHSEFDDDIEEEP